MGRRCRASKRRGGLSFQAQRCSSEQLRFLERWAATFVSCEQGCWSGLFDHAAAPVGGAFPSVASVTGMCFVLYCSRWACIYSSPFDRAVTV